MHCYDVIMVNIDLQEPQLTQSHVPMFLTKALNQAVALDIIKLVLCLGVKQLLVDTHVFMPTALCISFSGGVGCIVHRSQIL